MPYPKVSVVGASSSGLISAYILAKNGISVDLFEAQETFKPKERTLIVTSAINDILDFDISELVSNRISKFFLHASGKTLEITLSEPDLVIERSAILKALFERAEIEGARIHMGHRVTGLEVSKDSVKLILERNGHSQYLLSDYAILAGGIEALKTLNHHRSNSSLVWISQLRIKLPKGYDHRSVHCWFERDSTRFFYWIIPENEKSGVLGVIAERKEEARSLVFSFAEREGFRALSLQDESEVPIPNVKDILFPARNGRVYFVGDSGAQVKSTTVGGLVTGLMGGVSAANWIIKGRDSHFRSLKLELAFHTILRKVLDLLTDKDYAELFNLIDHQVLRILGDIKRDELSRMAKKVVFIKPKILAFLMKVLLRSYIVPLYLPRLKTDSVRCR